MIGIFIPLVILQSGGALWLIALYYLVYAAVKLTFNYPAMRIIQARGAHFGLGAGFFFGAARVGLMLAYTAAGNLVLLGVSAAALALTNAFVWNSQHLFISAAMDNATKSSSLASIEIAGKVLSLAGPLIGAAVGSWLGSSWLLGLSSLTILLTLIPLRRMGRLSIQPTVEPIVYGLSGAPGLDLLANFCFNVETTIGVMLWPIYLAVVLGSYGSIGAIAALSALASIVTVWIAGGRGDRGHDRSVLKQGVGVVSAVNLLRALAVTPLSIGLISAVYFSALSYLQNSWTSTYYGNAKTEGAQYIISMEIACDLAYVAVWGALLAVLLLSGSSSVFFDVAFIVAAVAAWGCLLVSRRGALEEPALV